MSAKAFLIDVAKCNGCYNCQIVCKDEHCGNDWSPIAAPQPETGHFWMRMEEKTRGQVPVVKVAYKPVMCAHCADAPCEKACPNGAYERRDDGLLIINPEKCQGCGACAEACPQGSIYMNAELGIAQKCTGCAHLLDSGWDVPRCVDACPHEAILWDWEERLEGIADAVALDEVAGFGPKAFYLNLPKRFIAGAVVDFDADELLIGAKVELRDANGIVSATETDYMGDFIFNQIEPGEYDVMISPEGYGETILKADVRDIDRTLGDIGVAKR